MVDAASLVTATDLLDSVPSDYLREDGPDLLARWDRHQGFWDARDAADLAAFPRPEHGKAARRGMNLAAQDHLSLAGHPAVRGAAVDAIGKWGVHSAGPSACPDGSPPLRALEERIAGLLGCRDAIVFPTGWAAGYAAVRLLARPDDHIVFDPLVRSCLQEGAASATRNLHPAAHLSPAAVEHRLRQIRAAAPAAGILVVTAALFGLDAATADLPSLQAICRRNTATLLVDVSEDLGSLGEDGGGILAEQGMTGQIDVVVGSLARCFASNGGFVASQARALRQALRIFAGTLATSSALSPVQAATALAALDIVQSEEGTVRRQRLLRNATLLRAVLQDAGFSLAGLPRPIVPVLLGGPAGAREMTRRMQVAGVVLDLAECPVVSRNAGRWLLRVRADHAPAKLRAVAALAAAARREVH